MVEAIATTDIVSAPTLHLKRDVPTVLFSFDRSGSSPESMAAADVVDARSEIAALAPVVSAAGEDGDVGAREILKAAAHEYPVAILSPKRIWSGLRCMGW